MTASAERHVEALMSLPVWQGSSPMNKTGGSKNLWLPFLLCGAPALTALWMRCLTVLPAPSISRPSFPPLAVFALPSRPYPPPQLLSSDTRGGGQTQTTQTNVSQRLTQTTHTQPAVSSGSCSSHGDKRCPRLRPTSPHVHVLHILGISIVRMPSRCAQSSESAYFAYGNPRVSGVGPSVWMRFC
jgi:hypothetical protein